MSEDRENTNRVAQLKTKKTTLINTWNPIKENLSHQWIDEEEVQKAKGVVRGAVHYCLLGENIGNEQNEERPVIIVSRDLINSTSGNILVAPLSKTLKKKYKNGRLVQTKGGKPIPKFSSHVFLFKDKYTFLSYDSAVMTEEIKSVSKVRLKDHLGTITDKEDLNRLDVRIKWTFGL
jgi:mRNA interferase MazF